jgi:hypothetical protein
MKNVFLKEDCDEFVKRINLLEPESKGLWGKMDVAQMLAHCNVSYEMVYDDIHPKPGFFLKFILKTLVKSKVVSETPYKHNNPTASQFIINDSRDFDLERDRLIAYINKTQLLGEKDFDGKESHSFGRLTATEWSNMFAKHLEHHLSQFGV